jgi:hypothetical protein
MGLILLFGGILFTVNVICLAQVEEGFFEKWSGLVVPAILINGLASLASWIYLLMFLWNASQL